jgi:hypothetical protein
VVRCWVCVGGERTKCVFICLVQASERETHREGNGVGGGRVGESEREWGGGAQRKGIAMAQALGFSSFWVKEGGGVEKKKKGS